VHEFGVRMYSGPNGTKSGTALARLWPIKRSTGSALSDTVLWTIGNPRQNGLGNRNGETTGPDPDGGGIGIGGILLIVLIVYLLLGRGGL
jgi:hypothetical protein